MVNILTNFNFMFLAAHEHDPIDKACNNFCLEHSTIQITISADYWNVWRYDVTYWITNVYIDWEPGSLNSFP